MKKLFVSVIIMFLLVGFVSIAYSKVYHVKGENLIIVVHPVEPEKKAKKTVPQEPKDNNYYELLGLYVANNVDYHLNVDIPSEFVDPIIDSFVTWWEVCSLNLFAYYETEKSWFENDGINTISFVKFTPVEYIAFCAIYYDPDITDPETGFNKIIDSDIVFNDLLKWGVDPDGEGPKKIRAFDVQNIATHEIGHALGMDDVYDDIYSELTMYGYGRKGETKKRSLENGDIMGVQWLYGITEYLLSNVEKVNSDFFGCLIESI